MLILIRLFIITAICFCMCGLVAQQKKPIDYTVFVNPLIGSEGHGHVFVGANVPSGAVQVGPSNILQNLDKFNGWD